MIIQQCDQISLILVASHLQPILVFYSKQWYVLGINIIMIKWIFKYWKYYLTGLVFGALLCLAIHLLTIPSNIPISIFIISNVIYHNAEFSFVNYCHPSTLSWDSFLINHSCHYSIAFLFSMLEYILTIYLAKRPLLFEYPLLLSVLICSVGHLFRIGAFISAHSNFHHRVQFTKNKHHQLVTTGFYQVSRHPGYAGFFYKQLGEQMLLQNKVCIVLSVLAMFYFFVERIAIEELVLESFFDIYSSYSQKVGIGIPLMQVLVTRRKQKYQYQSQDSDQNCKQGCDNDNDQQSYYNDQQLYHDDQQLYHDDQQLYYGDGQPQYRDNGVNGGLLDNKQQL